MSKKILCFLLVSVFLLTTLIGCAGDTEEPVESTEAASSDVAESVTDESESKPNDEDTLEEYDFDGAEYGILARSRTSYEFDHKNEHGQNSVNNAIFTRTQEIEARFNCKIRVSTEQGDWSNDKSPLITKYEAIAQTGWSEFSLVSDHFAMLQKTSMNGYCRDLTTLETVDMEKEWWSKQFYNNCNIEGKFYVAVGDIAYTFYEYMLVFFFNETMANEILKDAAGEPIDLYQMVRDDEWTWETLKEYTLKVSTLSGINQYGLLSNAHARRAWASAFEIDYMLKTGEGEEVKYSFPATADADAITKIDEIGEFYRAQNGLSLLDNKNDSADEGNLNPIFWNGDALFYPQMLGEIVKIGENIPASMEFGILPYPKWDGDQMEYHTAFRDTLSAITVPRNIQDMELAGVVTEALCMYGYQKIRPVYFENVIGDRYLDSSDLQEMMDIIRSSTTVDFAHAYSSVLGFPYSTIDSACSAEGEYSYATSYAESYESRQTKLDALYEAFGVS